MTAFRRNLAARVLIALASSAYAVVGVGGYGLHSLLPCAGGSCRGNLRGGIILTSGLRCVNAAVTAPCSRGRLPVS